MCCQKCELSKMNQTELDCHGVSENRKRPDGRPFFSIITVCKNDAWLLSKTMRSVFCQSFESLEYLVIDSDSREGTAGLISFWNEFGLVDKAIVEPDQGVYQAMNKGLKNANGQYLCFLNAGDVFADTQVLDRVHDLLASGRFDGVLGWGELNQQIWASWIETEAFKMASLGFCHQSLFVKTELLLDTAFDERAFKTDSDTLQLGQLYKNNANIAILPDVLAVRGGEPGLSSQLDRSRASIVDTLISEYDEVEEPEAGLVVDFRRKCAGAEGLVQWAKNGGARLRRHLCLMILDTLFLPQSANLASQQRRELFNFCWTVLHEQDQQSALLVFEKLRARQAIKAELLEKKRLNTESLKSEIRLFERQEKARLAALSGQVEKQTSTAPFVVTLTSFPPRLRSIHLVIQSLLMQSLKPPSIELWLGSDEIPGRQRLPSALLALEERGLHIHFAKRTCMQYDKFLHNSESNRDCPLIIVDDDVIYPPDCLEVLLNCHAEWPQAVCCNRANKIGLDRKDRILPYEKWQREVDFLKPSWRAFSTGAGGVLFPPGFFADDWVCDEQEILSVAPYADDVWLKMCSLLKGLKTVTTRLSRPGGWYKRYTPTMRFGSLHDTNVGSGLNDLQLGRAFALLDENRPHWRDLLIQEQAEDAR